MKKYGDDLVGDSWKKISLPVLKPNTLRVRSFPTSFHGSLMIADACLAFEQILDKVRNNKKKKNPLILQSTLHTSPASSKHKPVVQRLTKI